MIIDRFLRWWGGQLAELLPAGWRGQRGRARVALLVEESAEGVSLQLRRHGRVQALGPIEQAARKLPGSIGRGRARVVVRAQAGSVLVREVRLPAAAASAPRHALELNMDTYTPFRAEDVYFGYTPLSRRGAQGDLAVKLAVVPRNRLQRLLAPLAGLGLEPTGELEEADEAGRVGLVFQVAGGSRAADRWFVGTLAALNLALAILLVAVPWQRQLAAIDTLERRVAIAREEAEAVSEIEHQLEAEHARLQFVASQASTRTSMTLLVEEISRLLPDDSWLIGLQVSEGSVRLQGFSPRASSLIAALQASALLAQARFGSPVVSDPASGAERFDIQASIVQPSAQESGAVRTVAERGSTE